MKKQETMFRAVGEVGGDLIARASKPIQKRQPVWLRWTAMAACCALIIGAAAFAGIALRDARSSTPNASMQASFDTAAPETPRSTESAALAPQDSPAEAAEDSADFKSEAADTAGDDFEAPAEEAPAEETPENESVTAQTAPADTTAELYSFRIGGVLYEQIAADGMELQPGALLGTVEESDFSELLGCEIYACGGAEPAERVLLLLDGEYLPFQIAESGSAE